MLIIVALSMGGIACNEHVAAPTGVEEPFSVYGILNPRLTTQTLLVSPPSTLLLDYSDSIDAVVTSIDLASGELHVWRDSVVVGRRGQTDHIFHADFMPAFGSRHMVRVERSDGSASSVEIPIPDEVEIELPYSNTRLLRVRAIGEGIRVLGADVTYGVRYYREGMSTEGFCGSPYFKLYELPLDDSIEESPGEVVITIDMYEHEQLLRGEFAADFNLAYDVDAPRVLGLTRMKIEVAIGHDSWVPPDGLFDLDVLARPLALTNVSNGFGFVGAGYVQDMALWPSKAAVGDTWFADYLMRPPGECLNLCSCGLHPE